MKLPLITSPQRATSSAFSAMGSTAPECQRAGKARLIFASGFDECRRSYEFATDRWNSRCTMRAVWQARVEIGLGSSFNLVSQPSARTRSPETGKPECRGRTKFGRSDKTQETD